MHDADGLRSRIPLVKCVNGLCLCGITFHARTGRSWVVGPSKDRGQVVAMSWLSLSSGFGSWYWDHDLWYRVHIKQSSSRSSRWMISEMWTRCSNYNTTRQIRAPLCRSSLVLPQSPVSDTVIARRTVRFNDARSNHCGGELLRGRDLFLDCRGERLFNC